MSALLSELMLPGWAEGADARIGLREVTSVGGGDSHFTLPCHRSDPEIFFAEEPESVALAKSACSLCPLISACLEGAISRSEPCGVWGGELFESGRIIAAKRGVGRPRIRTLDEGSTLEPGLDQLDQAS